MLQRTQTHSHTDATQHIGCKIKYILCTYCIHTPYVILYYINIYEHLRVLHDIAQNSTRTARTHIILKQHGEKKNNSNMKSFNNNFIESQRETKNNIICYIQYIRIQSRVSTLQRIRSATTAADAKLSWLPLIASTSFVVKRCCEKSVLKLLRACLAARGFLHTARIDDDAQAISVRVCVFFQCILSQAEVHFDQLAKTKHSRSKALSQRFIFGFLAAVLRHSKETLNFKKPCCNQTVLWLSQQPIVALIYI